MHRQVVDTVRVDQRTAVVDKDRRIRPWVVVRVLAQALVVHFDVPETCTEKGLRRNKAD